MITTVAASYGGTAARTQASPEIVFASLYQSTQVDIRSYPFPLTGEEEEQHVAAAGREAQMRAASVAFNSNE